MRKWPLPVFLSLFAFALSVEGGPASYLRVARPSTNSVQLEIALRRFVPTKGNGPEVWLSGVAHIGSPEYYKALQKHLDQRDLVLYEGVGSPLFMEDCADSDEARVAHTQAAMAYLVLSAEKHKDTAGEFPRSLADLAEGIKRHSSREVLWMKHARRDAWGREFACRVDEGAFRVTSLGGDGEKGGAAGAADLVLESRGEGGAQDEGLRDIQTTLADVLGLDFQLNALDYDRDHFTNSDMSMSDLEKTMGSGGEADADADVNEVMGILNGDASMGAMVKGALGILTANPKMRALAKVMLIETMGGLKGDLSQIRSLGPSMAKLMKVLIEDRNRIVMNDLKAVLARPKRPSSVSLFYGAGHMDNMERALVGELGYKAADEVWLPAFSVNYAEVGLTHGDLAMIRALSELQKQLLQPPKAATTPRQEDLQLFDPLWEE